MIAFGRKIYNDIRINVKKKKNDAWFEIITKNPRSFHLQTRKSSKEKKMAKNNKEVQNSFPKRVTD